MVDTHKAMDTWVSFISWLDETGRDSTPYEVPRGKLFGTMRAWFAGRGGHVIDTVQIDGRDGSYRSGWTPGRRTLNEVRASYVKMDGSRADYAGTRVLAATEDVCLVCYKFGDIERVVMYRDMGSR